MLVGLINNSISCVKINFAFNCNIILIFFFKLFQNQTFFPDSKEDRCTSFTFIEDNYFVALRKTKKLHEDLLECQKMKATFAMDEEVVKSGSLVMFLKRCSDKLHKKEVLKLKYSVNSNQNNSYFYVSTLTAGNSARSQQIRLNEKVEGHAICRKQKVLCANNDDVSVSFIVTVSSISFLFAVLIVVVYMKKVYHTGFNVGKVLLCNWCFST